MLFSTIADISKRQEAELIALPFWEKPKGATSFGKTLEALVKPPINAKDFTGKEGESALIYADKEKEKRVLLLGLGKEENVTLDALRKAFAQVVKIAIKKKLKKINVVLPNIVELRNFTAQDCLKAICEGILSANYKWDEKTGEEHKGVLLTHVALIGVNPKMAPIIDETVKVFEGVYLARDLVNGNADLVTPHYLCEIAKKLSKNFPKIETTVFDRKRLEKEKMGLILGVGQGATHEPAFIMASYQGHPKSKDHTIIVGKGITFDTGGLNIKPTGSMETMKGDMAGAAAVLGTIAAVAALGLKINVTAVVATAENAVDANSFKPGDVHKGYAGKTVEIGNTDAEGRLVLADALAYAAKHLKPTRMIDLATLTGAVVIALGEDVAGLVANDDTLANQLLASSETTSENIWRLPLYQPYKENLKSDIADLKNISGGRGAGTIIGALFLEEFVEKVPWAHLDIAGVAFAPKEKQYLPKHGTGFGIRLLIDFLKNL